MSRRDMIAYRRARLRRQFMFAAAAFTVAVITFTILMVVA